MIEIRQYVLFILVHCLGVCNMTDGHQPKISVLDPGGIETDISVMNWTSICPPISVSILGIFEEVNVVYTLNSCLLVCNKQSNWLFCMVEFPLLQSLLLHIYLTFLCWRVHSFRRPVPLFFVYLYTFWNLTTWTCFIHVFSKARGGTK